jgi:hypothetical protein
VWPGRSGFSRELHVHHREQFAAEAAPAQVISLDGVKRNPGTYSNAWLTAEAQCTQSLFVLILTPEVIASIIVCYLGMIILVVLELLGILCVSAVNKDHSATQPESNAVQSGEICHIASILPLGQLKNAI